MLKTLVFLYLHIFVTNQGYIIVELLCSKNKMFILEYNEVTPALSLRSL